MSDFFVGRDRCGCAKAAEIDDRCSPYQDMSPEWMVAYLRMGGTVTYEEHESIELPETCDECRKRDRLFNLIDETFGEQKQQ